MFVRTKYGIIDKILKLNKSYVKGVSQKDELYAYDIDNIVKSSYNIIDILEVGDMVNSLIVAKISEDNETKKKYINLYGSLCEWENEDIKSVITHEQMEQMAYKVEE